MRESKVVRKLTPFVFVFLFNLGVTKPFKPILVRKSPYCWVKWLSLFLRTECQQ